MTMHWTRTAVILSLILAFCILGAGVGYTDGKTGMEGWEKDSAYNKLYDPNEAERFKGVVKGTKEVTPLPNMAPGVALMVEDSLGELVTVHLGPKSYVDRNRIAVKKGDKVKVKGVWVEIGEDDVFIASKVKKGTSYEYKVRLTKDGTPLWTMSPAQLAKERAGQ